ncbi:myb-like dna-binding [Plasmopara halstedii]|uniref:Myb-like dna-binding n=1 Tax=Plasmopara halstedii TaxID=4781 RepID=A0A0P1AUR7_PLAHL|nr:myb-like dna-binding [Plasmopara halstedii]CEG46137.1 myb-like dna-binding [Plasmopara halstedii]|eukprot:XP_024582506.1 myb-like dna-binding [Plasmopara halstedii]
MLSSSDTSTTNTNRTIGIWSTEEHDRFLDALKLFPQGPWKIITEYIGTRSVRQVQTHAQKYQEKVSRRLQGLQMGKAIRLRREHRIDHDVLALRTLITLPARNKHTTSLSVVREESCRQIHQIDKIECHGVSPSSTSSFDFPDFLEYRHLDEEELPTLSESLDFFIENMA